MILKFVFLATLNLHVEIRDYLNNQYYIHLSMYIF